MRTERKERKKERKERRGPIRVCILLLVRSNEAEGNLQRREGFQAVECISGNGADLVVAQIATPHEQQQQ